ncbi:MAG: LytTR family DNA-binding domain-containing protein [Chitinophagales bacterium]|nr:LytTR family DNA-binding domain-containing protein [Chitinophagales bacterium]
METLLTCLNMLNCVIVDDDLAASNLLKHFVSNTSGLNLVQMSNDSVAGANFIREQKHSIDLIFLDIEMPQMSGIELLSSIKELPSVVIVSSKEKYALEAYEYNVEHYLTKPLEYSKFLKVIEKVLVKKEKAMAQVQLDYMFIKTSGSMAKVKYDDIFYFSANGDYIQVHTKEKMYVVNSTMRNIDDKLKSIPNFVRVHRSYIINADYLENLNAEVAIVSKKVIPIGNKYKSELQDKLVII